MTVEDAVRQVLAGYPHGCPTWSVAEQAAKILGEPYTSRTDHDRMDGRVRRVLVKLAAAGEVRHERAGRYAFWALA